MPYTVVELGKVVITFKDEWVGGASYFVLDVVTDADSSYICILDAPAGTALTNTTYWRFLAKGTYRLWLAAGNTGTVQDFFDSFKGVKGDDGKSAWQAAVEAGYTHSEQQFGEDLLSIQNKVDKVSGKGLSTNDYDDAAETKLAGIEAGAEVNNISDINAIDLTDGGATTLHKHALANMDDDATHRIVTDAEKSTWNGKQDELGYTAENAANKKSTITNSETDYPTSGAVYAANLLDEKIADVKLIQPAIAYYKRVIADSGTVGDRTILANLFTAKLKSLPTTQMLYFPHVGIKQRTSGLNKFASKVYDLGLSNIDAVQATEGTQPYTTVNAAPLSLIGPKYVSGQSQTGEIAFTEKTYQATDSWTFTARLKANKRVSTRILLGANSFMTIDAATITISNGTTVLLSGAYSFDCGKATTIEFAYSNATGLISINGLPVVTTVQSGTMAFSKIAYSSTYPFDGVWYYAHLQNERIATIETQQYHAILSVLIPEIEGVAIGNQHWATSNYEGITDGAGNNILEAQLAVTGDELITNAADREFTSDTGFWSKNAGVTIADGVTKFNGVAAGNALYKGSFLTVGKKYLVTFEVKNYSAGGIKPQGGNYSGTTINSNIVSAQIIIPTTATIYFISVGASTTLEIDNVSIKELGWADATTIYDARIAAGDTVKAAALAASMLSGYSNTAANMAIYGKLYNAYAARTIDYASPINWRVPSYASWLQMATALGGITVAGGRLKKDTIVYWTTPNTGATNDSGFSAIANGLRGIDGTFASVGEQANFWTSDGYLVTLNYNAATITFTAGADPRIGAAIRLMRNEPVGNDMEIVSTGWFTTNIASSAKSILCKFGYFVRAINISTTPNITGIEAKLYNAAGSAVATLFTNQACNATTINFDVSVNQPELFQDGTVRITATGNGATGTPPLGMKIEVIYGKTKKSV